MIPKRRRFRSEALRLAGHQKPCVLCGGPRPSMPCHLPHNVIGFPAGMGQKTHDWLTADCCDDCHARLDRGDWRNDHGVRMRAFCLTLQRRFDEGVLRVAGEDHEAPEFTVDALF